MGGEREEIVNQFDQTLQKRGVKIIRDKRDFGYKGSIRDFNDANIAVCGNIVLGNYNQVNDSK